MSIARKNLRVKRGPDGKVVTSPHGITCINWYPSTGQQIYSAWVPLADSMALIERGEIRPAVLRALYADRTNRAIHRKKAGELNLVSPDDDE